MDTANQETRTEIILEEKIIYDKLTGQIPICMTREEVTEDQKTKAHAREESEQAFSEEERTDQYMVEQIGRAHV